MKKDFKFLLLSVPCLVASLGGCALTQKPVTSEPVDSTPSVQPSTPAGESTPAESTPTVEKKLEYAPGTTLRVAAGYNSKKTAISFQDTSIFPEGGELELADGKKYHSTELKPTWQFISTKLSMNFEDKYTGKSAKEEFNAWNVDTKLSEVDIVAGNASQLTEAGALDKLVNIADYLDYMPNFKAYLEENEIARLSITGNTENGAIYFSPYFDGVDDIERMPLMRADLVRTLLDGDAAYSGANRELATAVYQPYMPTTGSVQVDALKADGSGTEKVTKDYSKYGNIVKKMNDAGTLTGNQAVAMLREYIDKTYAGKYAKRSDLFLGKDACWDADEMVALLRCGVASLNDANGNAITGIFSREISNMQRDIDLTRFGGSLFGARGMESRQDYLYFTKDGNLHDGRQEAACYDAMLRMNQMTQEGLIAVTGTQKSEDYLKLNAGLMSYDYNQTQTVMNDTVLNKDGDTGREYTAVMVPVARWDDGTGEQYMRFTESWRSVKTDGWALSKAGIGDDQNKLHAALQLIDFAFSVQGQITMSYGPDEFIKVKDANVDVKTWEDVAKKYETFNFNGKEMPVVSDATYAELYSKAKGNYTNYARFYLGSTLNGFPKSQAFEYQCTSAIGKKGSAILSAAIGAGIIKHPVLAVNSENMWYTSVPTTLPTSKEQKGVLDGLTTLSENFGSSSSSKNVFYYLISEKSTKVDKFDVGTGATMAKYVVDNFSGEDYTDVRQEQWEELLAFYNKLH